MTWMGNKPLLTKIVSPKVFHLFKIFECRFKYVASIIQIYTRDYKTFC